MKIIKSEFEPVKIIVIVNIIIKEERLNIKLKLFLIKTPIIRIEQIDTIKKISGIIIFKLFIIFNMKQAPLRSY